MGFTVSFSWAETEISKLGPQLINIGVQLDTPLGASLGATPAIVTRWKRGAAVVIYAAARLLAVRGYGTALTNRRDNFLIDRTPERLILPELTLPPIPAEVQAALDDPDFLTDFLDWCDKFVRKMEENGLTNAQRQQLGLLILPTPTPKEDMVAEIRSIHDHPGGQIVVNANRNNQPQIKAIVTLDTGEVLEKTLPSAAIPFHLPTDRVHSFTVVVYYADKFGTTYGQSSSPKSGRSEL